MAEVRVFAEAGSLESTALRDASRPIVLLSRKRQSTICASVAPDSNAIGVMLPYSPLHVLLLDEFGGPVVW